MAKNLLNRYGFVPQVCLGCAYCHGTECAMSISIDCNLPESTRLLEEIRELIRSEVKGLIRSELKELIGGKLNG